MKKLLVFLFLSATVALTSCSKDNDDVDPIVGTWAMDSSFTINDSTTSNREEWIFKEDNTGQFSEYDNGVLDDTVSFTWSKAEEIYTVISEETSESGTFKIGNLLGSKTLLDEEDFVVAIRE